MKRTKISLKPSFTSPPPTVSSISKCFQKLESLVGDSMDLTFEHADKTPPQPTQIRAPHSPCIYVLAHKNKEFQPCIKFFSSYLFKLTHQLL